MFNISQIIVLLLLTILIVMSIRNKFLKIFFSLILVGVFLLETVSLFLTNTLIDYRFYTHMNIESIENFGFLFLMQILFAIIIYIIINLLILKISSKYKIKLLINIVLISISIVYLFLPKGIIYNFNEIYKIVNAKSKTFSKALTDLGIDPHKYVLPQDIKAKKGKNIIVISIESLEQGYLGKNFYNITPHLTELSKKWTFYKNMPVSPGAGWTAGSLYSHQVGVPAFFKDKRFIKKILRDKNGYINEEGQGNTLFQSTSSAKLVGLGTVFNKAGYDSHYIMGRIEFAGEKDILETYGFKTISEKNSIGKYKPKLYGFDDLELFKEAKLQINDMTKNKNRPFALFMSTINTHFPNGIYDKRMEKYIPKRENKLEFAVASVDYLINDFIQFLKTKGLLENTSIYIFPDHLLMGRGGSVHEKLAKSKRQLYLITNVNESILHKKTNETIYQIDLPKIILEGAQIKHNAKFLVDFINSDVLNVLDKKRVQITTLNQASLARENFKNAINVKINNLYININSGSKSIKMPINIDYSIIDLTFTPDMVLIKKEILTRHNIFKAVGYDIKDKLLHLTIVVENKKIKFIYLGNRQKVGLLKDGNNSIFSVDDIISIVKSNKSYFKNLSEPIVKVNKEPNTTNLEIFNLKSESNYTYKTISCDIEEINGTMFISSKNADPSILLPKLYSNSKYIILSINLESPTNTKFQIFYKHNLTDEYNERNSYTKEITQGENSLHLRIPSKYINNGLRVDIVSNPGKYKLNILNIKELK